MKKTARKDPFLWDRPLTVKEDCINLVLHTGSLEWSLTAPTVGGALLLNFKILWLNYAFTSIHKLQKYISRKKMYQILRV